MNITPMDQIEIFKAIDYCYQTKQYTIQVILVDGKTVLGSIPAQVSTYTVGTGERKVPSSKDRCFLNNALIIYYGKIFHEHSIYIPLDIIGGINIINYEEDVIELDSDPIYSPATNMSVSDYIFEDLFSYAIKNKLEIEPHFFQYMLVATKPFVWGDLSYKADVDLYADWNYLKNVSGGINSLGAGVGVFSLSGGWTRSLWSQFKDKVKQKRVDICKIEDECEVVIQGYITFIEYYPEFPVLKGSVNTAEMEGGRWLSAIISTKRISSVSEINGGQWALIYLREDGLMFPKMAWERISNPINIFCEVVHTFVVTEIGTAPFFLKARCAAYIK